MRLRFGCFVVVGVGLLIVLGVTLLVWLLDCLCLGLMPTGVLGLFVFGFLFVYACFGCVCGSFWLCSSRWLGLLLLGWVADWVVF